MKVLVACEFSGVVRDAFLRNGHDAWSCDLLPTESPGPHYDQCVLEVLASTDGWDLLIAHPPCTYLCNSGIHWNKRRPERKAQTERALDFFTCLLNYKSIPMRAIENPVGIVSTRVRKPDQIVQPYQYGHDASKKTCLWLEGLPVLEPTGPFINPRIVQNGKWEGMPRWGNQANCGRCKLGSSTKDRWKKRSVTYEGIAQAMADQWGSLEWSASHE